MVHHETSGYLFVGTTKLVYVHWDRVPVSNIAMIDTNMSFSTVAGGGDPVVRNFGFLGETGPGEDFNSVGGII